MITSEAGKALIQTCLNSPDPPGDDNAMGPPKDYRMSATGYEETDLSYHVPDDEEEHEREENGEGEDEDDIRDLREDGFRDSRDTRERSASPPRDEEDNERLEESQHQVPEESRDCVSDGGDDGNQGPPVMTIPPHVLSQILSSPGFSLQGRNLIIPGHVPPIPVSLPYSTPPPPSHHQHTTPPAPTSPLNLERRPKQRTSPTQQSDNTPHNLSLPKR